MSWEALAGAGVTVSASPVESRRFRTTIGRVTVGWNASDAAADNLTATLAAAEQDILIVRWPTHLLGLGSAAAAAGRLIIPADTLTYWEIPAGVLSENQQALPTGFRCDPATTHGQDATAAVIEIVRDSFRSYGNHYLANPALDPDLALAGYVEWALGSLEREPDNVLILTDGRRPVGLATMEQDSTGHDLEVLLAGIAADHQARGLYRHLFDRIDRAAVERSCHRIVISTQVHNVKVQRAWAKMGLRPFAAITTIHAVRRERDPSGA